VLKKTLSLCAPRQPPQCTKGLGGNMKQAAGKATAFEQRGAIDLELMADTLKERIYATLALLAVLISIDASHTTALHVELLIGGTALSLWAASWIASQLARQMIFGRPDAEHIEREKQRHAPLLLSAVLPMFIVGLSIIRVFPLHVAISASTYLLIITLALWALMSAYRMRVGRGRTVILASFVTLLGLGIVALKAALGH